MFVVGIAGIIHQTLLTSGDRPYLLAVFTAMLGVPVYLQSAAKPMAAEEEDVF